MASDSPTGLGELRKSEKRDSRSASADRRLTQTYVEASSLSIALAKMPAADRVRSATGEDVGHRKDSNSGPMMPGKMNLNEASVAQRSLNMRVHQGKQGKRASTELISSNERELRVSLLRRKLMMEEEPIRHRRTYRTAPSMFLEFNSMHAHVGACILAATPPLLASAPEPSEPAAPASGAAASANSSRPSSPAQRSGDGDDKAPVMLGDLKSRLPQSSKHAFNPNVLSMRAVPGRLSSMTNGPPLLAFRATSNRASSSRRFSQLAATVAESSDDAIRQLINEDGSSDEEELSERDGAPLGSDVAGRDTMTEATAIAKMREQCARTAAQAAADHASAAALGEPTIGRAASLFALDELDDRELIDLTRDEGSDEEEEDYMRQAEAIGNANVFFPDEQKHEQKQARRAARDARSAARSSAGGGEGKAEGEGEGEGGGAARRSTDGGGEGKAEGEGEGGGAARRSTGGGGEGKAEGEGGGEVEGGGAARRSTGGEGKAEGEGAGGGEGAARRSAGGGEGKAEGEGAAEPPDVGGDVALAPVPEPPQEPAQPAPVSTAAPPRPKSMKISDLIALRKANVGRSASQDSIASTDSSEETPRSNGGVSKPHFAVRRSILPATSSTHPASSDVDPPSANPHTEAIVLPYEILVRPHTLPENVDVAKRELYLAQEEFEQVFGMSREAFVSLPKWKRVEKKKQTRLF